MTFDIIRLTPATAALLDHVAPDVFDAPVSPERLRAYLAAPGHVLIVAVEAGLVIGQAAGVVHHHPDKPNELYVDEVGTASTHRRQGVARALLTALADWGRAEGCTEAWLGTETDNGPAIALYRGFAPAEEADIRYFLFSLGAE